jgi:para-aminobenzoate synthetase / 4-amino-4-deoxychorismate lyase
VGVVAYDAAPAFDAALTATRDPALPLLAFRLFRSAVPLRPPAARPGARAVWEPDLGPSAYAGAVRAIRARLGLGQCYQVNLTFRLARPFAPDEDPYRAFHALARAQGARHPLYLDLGRHVLACASPELFFAREGSVLRAQPMKGTARRAAEPAADRAAARALWRSPKERAENLMITDMLRHDLGRVAEIGSVRVPRLWALEAYPMVWQMTSHVTARSGAPLAELFAALFPCASVTGAPKAAAMRAIRELERTPRGFYTGAAGVVEPGGDARFAVAIRTLTFDRETGRASYGTGSAVVWDSEPAGEYAECLAKAGVLNARAPRAGLIETLRWTPRRGYVRLAAHRRRLRRSAAALGIPFVPRALDRRLASAAQAFPHSGQRVRVLLGAGGALLVTHGPAPARICVPWRLALAPFAVDPDEPSLYHKTTRRDLYSRALRACPHADEVLLWNTRGELTEATRANLALRLRGEPGWVTPPIRCGLLGGVARAALLSRGVLRERVVRVDELPRVLAIRLVNSLRGAWPAMLLPGPGVPRVRPTGAQRDPAG